ncbi:PREDICTED: SAGA-associated factor 73-like [Ipomoea nil]|uniref:SAGA-associated factor 73-like n=1 Tax=Ipomoea nil TaxID=35883 RepID=UPI0009015B37|nr:PREDICTED: SAGA-associated factor 73-like [Ipomoea nil]
MKQLRYALLLSKVKTSLEKEHRNDPNCNVSGSKDEHGREIEEDESNEEDEDNDDDDVEDADDEHDDDDDDDNDDNLGNVRFQGDDPAYDSDPILIGPDYDTFPQRSPLRKLPSDSDDTKEDSHQAQQISNEHPEDMSRAIVPHIPHMDETSIKREEATEGKMEASPILLSSASGGKREAPPQDEHMDTSQTNIEEESPPESPRTITNQMRETVHTAENVHLQYLVLRQKDTKVLDDLCKKFLERIAKTLHELNTFVNKIARQQHELKHSHFSLKERVDLACMKIDTSQDNSYQLGEYALQILGYTQDILVTVSLSKREQTNLRQRLMKNNKVTMDGIGNFVDFVPYEEGSDSPQGVIHNAAFKVHTESGKSYQEGMNSFELISWWKAGIVEGRKIREAYNNYTSLNIKGKHEVLVKTNPIKVFRKRINEEIDFTRMLKQQKERDDREHKEAEQQKSKLLEL